MVQNFRWLCPDWQRGRYPQSTGGRCFLARHPLVHLGFPHLLRKRSHQRVPCSSLGHYQTLQSQTRYHIRNVGESLSRFSVDPSNFHVLHRGGNWIWYLPSRSNAQWSLEGPHNFHDAREFTWLPGAYRSVTRARIEARNVARTTTSGARMRGARPTTSRDYRRRWSVRARARCTTQVSWCQDARRRARSPHR